jgi:hypothetical protein
MPVTTLTFNLNDTEDYELLLVRLKGMVQKLEGIEQLRMNKQDDGVPISEAELCRRLQRKPPTIAAYRSQGMPYIAGKPCTYIYSLCYDWLLKTRGIKIQPKP